MYLTVAQTPIFRKYAAAIWTSDELDRLVNWIALDPLAGDVIPGSGGLRKVRWFASSRGKRGGARVIYYNLLQHGTVVDGIHQGQAGQFAAEGIEGVKKWNLAKKQLIRKHRLSSATSCAV